MASASALINPLASISQLEQSSSQLDGISDDLEKSVLFAGACLTQQAGALLSLRQDVVAQAVILFTRFWTGSDGGSLKEHGARDISAACIYLTAKTSATPKSPRNVINVFAYLGASRHQSSKKIDPLSYYVTEGDFQRRREQLFKHEAAILQTLGYELHVALPYNLCVNYLQILDVLQQPLGKAVASKAIAYLNSALLSPQQLYLTHQPSSLATSAIYLAARELGLKMPDGEWWEIFDVSREELGFLVVAHLSLEGFVRKERERWRSSRVPMTVRDVERELDAPTATE